MLTGKCREGTQGTKRKGTERDSKSKVSTERRVKIAKADFRIINTPPYQICDKRKDSKDLLDEFPYE